MSDTLYVETFGQGAPLILLHGWGWHSGIWHPLVPKLAEHYEVFLIDLPGFGKSLPLATNYTIENIAETLCEVLPSPATWLGWSLGGMIAWWIAIHFPEKVARLVTVAASTRFTEDASWPGVKPDLLEKFKELLLQNHEKTLQDFLALQLRGSKADPELRETLTKLTHSSPEISIPALLGGLEILRTLDLREKACTIHCPSLHIFGAHDTLVSARVATLIQPHLPNGRFEIIKRAGHIPFLVQPSEFLYQLFR